MQSQDVRRSFVDFFKERGHLHVPSAPLVPHGDPTLLFTNAGMVQFKDYFLGRETPPSKRAVTAQKCLRVSGKHNDLENVGPSPRHHTFFEMLGNFSFGDYFKADAIAFAWELVTKTWGLEPAHLFASVFEKDDEAFELWRKISSLPAERIATVKMGTTIATNALLERKGEPTALFITRGLRDQLRIGYQNRPRIFDRRIVLPEVLYGAVRLAWGETVEVSRTVILATHQRPPTARSRTGP